MSDSVCFGVHLGNSSICLALNRDGKSEVLANDLGNRVTAAVLAYNDSEWEIGASAKLGQSRNKPVIVNNKLVLNNETPENCSSSECRLVTEDEGGASVYEIQTEDRLITISPDDVAAKLLRNMYNVGQGAARVDGAELRCVLSVPLHWNENARRRLETAAGLAGFNVLQVMNEPAAALIGAGGASEGYVLVYRLGGTSCDVTLVEVCAGLYSVEYSSYHPGLGGNSLTALLADYMAEEFFRKWKLNPQENRRAMNKLRLHAEECKRVLSTMESCHAHVESLLEGVDWSQNITRARFDNLIGPKVAQFMEPLNAVLKLQNDKKIKQIILCGGGMKVPKLQATIAGLFPEAELLNGFSPDELIAIGCAKQAELLLQLPDLDVDSGSVEIDCIQEPIFAKYNDDTLCLFPVGTPSHYEVTLPLKIDSAQGGQSISISIYESDESQTLGSFTFSDVPTKPSIQALLSYGNVSIKVL